VISVSISYTLLEQLVAYSEVSEKVYRKKIRYSWLYTKRVHFDYNSAVS